MKNYSFLHCANETFLKKKKTLKSSFYKSHIFVWIWRQNFFCAGNSVRVEGGVEASLEKELCSFRRRRSVDHFLRSRNIVEITGLGNLVVRGDVATFADAASTSDLVVVAFWVGVFVVRGLGFGSSFKRQFLWALTKQS